MIGPAKYERAAEKRPAAAFVWLPSVTKNSQRSTLLLALLGLAFALLSIAAVEPGPALRLRTVRVIARHQVQIGWLGGALLVSTILLFFLL